jgi:O-antigen/teichoic acid export membrane protein
MQALGVTGIQVLVGWYAPSALGLAMGYVLGLLIGVVAAAYMMPIPLRVFLPWVSFRLKLADFWIRHRRFPLFSLPADLINSVSWQLPLVLIASRFGAESSGYFALAIRVLGAPVGMLGNAILDVFKRKASSSFRENGNCTPDFLSVLRILTVFSVFFALAGSVLVEELFALVYGESWRRAGEVATWLLPLFAFRFVASPLSYVFYLAQGQSVDLLWQCVLLIMTVTCLVFGKDFESAVAAYAAGYSALYAVYLYLAYRFSKGLWTRSVVAVSEKDKV